MLKKFTNIKNKYGIQAGPSSDICEIVNQYKSKFILNIMIAKEMLLVL